MAASNGRKTASSNKRTAQSRKKTSTQRKKTKAQAAQDSALFHEIGLIVLFAAMVFLFCCNFGIIGPIGDAVSGILFGLFGLAAYAVPVLLFLAVAFYFANGERQRCPEAGGGRCALRGGWNRLRSGGGTCGRHGEV